MIQITADQVERIDIDGQAYEVRPGDCLCLTRRESSNEEYMENPFMRGGTHWTAEFRDVLPEERVSRINPGSLKVQLNEYFEANKQSWPEERRLPEPEEIESVINEAIERGEVSEVRVNDVTVFSADSLAGIEPPKYAFEAGLNNEEWQWLMDNSSKERNPE